MIDDFDHSQLEPAKVGRSQLKRAFIGAFVVAIMMAITTASAGFFEINSLDEAFEGGERIDDDGELTAAEAGDPQTILLLGSDSRFIDVQQKNPVRSDTMILVRLNPNKAATTVMSIPRDLKVEIPGYGTDKINAAYALGGPKLTLKTIKQLLGIEINHVVNVNFGGFRRAVDYLGCVYMDVDRRYFNDNSGPGPDYATIDIQAGYQKLCGQDALDFARYRHEDTDLVRAARQQDFMSQARQQVGVQEVVKDRKALAKIFGRYTQTDIRGRQQITRLLKLIIFSSSQPIREVSFPADIGEEYLTVTPQRLERAVNQFMNAKASKGPRGKLSSTKAERKAAKKQKRRKKLPAGMEDATTAGQDQAVLLTQKTKFPVYYPKLRTRLALYSGDPRSYAIRDYDGKIHRAYRMVIKKGTVGEYYGVQGTTWKDPPMLKSPSEKRKVDGRELELFFDGNRLRFVAWRTDRAVYWVSNTLLKTLTNSQMLAIAGSLSRLK